VQLGNTADAPVIITKYLTNLGGHGPAAETEVPTYLAIMLKMCVT